MRWSNGDRAQGGKNVDGVLQHIGDAEAGQDDTGAQNDHAAGPVSEANLALHAEGLSARSRVRNHEGADDRASCGRRRELVLRGRKRRRDHGEHHALLDPIQGGIQERAKRRGLPDMREYLPSSMSQTEPTMKAMPPSSISSA